MSTQDKRIREFAYQIWESEGKPEGQEARHWEMASKLAEAEALAPKKAPKATGSKTPASKPAAGAKTLNGKAAEPKAKTTKAKPAAAASVIAPGEKAAEKKPRAPRKPPAA
ncbi:DUF2934 domain-containing protein [Pseudomonas sp. C1C7]|uniref:DUF2934 domain-containing protein n=1 Tax=Pseudomonas sp. C1C7 TaxID=2735272 RepID=UPI001586740B|nr:DUF2934 domain-containing protein [Pseudomonas sp. C1C7]NUT78920.1 DUF2934 domain-containing protein [Pseudomonas sp. C1C7]